MADPSQRDSTMPLSITALVILSMRIVRRTIIGTTISVASITNNSAIIAVMIIIIIIVIIIIIAIVLP